MSEVKSAGVMIIADAESVDDFMRSDEFKEFTKEANAYIDSVLAEAKRDLSPAQVAEFEEWWAGKRSRTDDPKVSSAILWAIGQGLG
jgi:hypothetical protein